MSEVGEVHEGLKSMFVNRSLGMNAKTRLYVGVVMPNALYGAEIWNMVAEGRRLIEMKTWHLRNMCVVAHTN